jgi:hypothetical protein
MEKLEPEKKRTREEVNALSLESAKYDIISDREYPYFFFPPESFPDPQAG